MYVIITFENCLALGLSN